jgi:anthranilate synthase component 1
MEIIDSLERGPRGVYTGAIGMIDATGDVDLSIAIRTAVVAGERLSLHVGGGIVADSDANAELQETRDKAAAFVRLGSGEA